MSKWYFRPKSEGETVQERVAGEFFSPIDQQPGRALVREGIQNALDATPDNEKTSVRIAMFDDDSALKMDKAEVFFDGLWPHIEASAEINITPSEKKACPYLLFEDFGIGLEGDPADGFGEDEDNHFFHFFRAEGKSDKRETDRGSWGIGKSIFTRTSRINCMFGFTRRRSDNNRLLMGKSILEYHKLNGEYFQEGYFGKLNDGYQEGPVMPINEEETLDNFAQIFDLGRGNSSGLSIVVPWPRTDIEKESLIKAVIEEYFYPIIENELEVFIELPGVRIILDSDTLIDEAYKLREELEEGMNDNILNVLDLASWSKRIEEQEKYRINMPDPDRRWQWKKDLFPTETLEKLKKLFRENQKIAIEVPVTVRPTEGEPQESYFEVYLTSNPDERERPVFVRDGIIIPKVNPPRTRGVTGLVIAEDDPLTKFLRAAENPAHTGWEKGTSKFKGKYTSGVSDLRFVVRSVHEIVKIITASDKKPDKTLLADFFPVPPADEEKGIEDESNKTDGGNGEPGIPAPTPPGPTPKSYRIYGVKEGGFRVVPGDEEADCPAVLDIQVAYDVRRGNPLKNYDPEDFELDQESIEIKYDGLLIISNNQNRLIAEIEDSDFSIKVTGFNQERDLYVRVEDRGGDYVGSAS